MVSGGGKENDKKEKQIKKKCAREIDGEKGEIEAQERWRHLGRKDRGERELVGEHLRGRRGGIEASKRTRPGALTGYSYNE